MKRKVIQLGDAQAITLPKIWTVENSLKNGEKVEVEGYKDLLLIDLNREDNSEVEMDLADLEQDLIWRYLISAYRKGTKKVIIRFKDKKDLEIIQQLTKDLLGMVIINQDKNKLIMSDMFSNDKTDIDDSLKKIFALLIGLSRSSLEAIENNDKSSLANIPYHDFNINKFANLSIRLLNIKGHKDWDKTNSVYKIISLLEEIGDEYRRLSLVYPRTNGKASKSVLGCFREVNTLLKSYYDLYYDFDRETLKKFYSEADEILKKLKEGYEKANSADVQILSSLDTILHLIKNLSEENMVVKL